MSLIFGRNELRERLPLYAESMDIIDKQAGTSAKILVSKFFPIAYHPFFRVIMLNQNSMKKRSLRIFALCYAHELGHKKHILSIVSITRIILTFLSTLIFFNIFILFYRGEFDAFLTAAFIIIFLRTIRIPFTIRDEHQQDLFAYNITGVLPSEFLTEKGKYSGAVVKILFGYPTVAERKNYVLKKGNPRPALRLLELYNLDASSR
jgi:hypothetical protein